MSREQEKFEDIEIYPVSASEQGYNAYYIPGCAVVGHQPAYAACLKKCADRKNGRLATHLSDCSAAIGKKECPAQKMRKEELAEGRAIYFINRKKLQAFHQYQQEMTFPKMQAVMSGDRAPSKSAPKRPAPVAPKIEPAKPTHFLDVNTGSYADAINAAITAPRKPAEPAPKPTPQPVPATAAPVKAGMSLLEMARLQMAARA